MLIKEVAYGEITGQYAPTNSLLKPEYDPARGTVKTAQAEKDDQQIDLDKLATIASRIVPGETTDPTPDVDLEQLSTKKSLFTRGIDGKLIVPGLETPETRAKKVANSSKIKAILDQM